MFFVYFLLERDLDKKTYVRPMYVLHIILPLGAIGDSGGLEKRKT